MASCCCRSSGGPEPAFPEALAAAHTCLHLHATSVEVRSALLLEFSVEGVRSSYIKCQVELMPFGSKLA